ncbi:hypothetical protein GGI21_003550 [Coemansia aciculifera]|nr:hypothetical protein GGI21_003550 [Coemansia aciculifera]
MGWFGYHQYYPSPFDHSQDTSIPYPPRIPEEEVDAVQQSFGMKSFARVTGNDNGQAVGSSSGGAGGSVAAASTSGEQPQYLPHHNPSTGSVHSQQYGSQVGPRTPAQAHAMQHSREALVGPYGAQ